MASANFGRFVIFTCTKRNIFRVASPNALLPKILSPAVTPHKNELNFSLPEDPEPWLKTDGSPLASEHKKE